MITDDYEEFSELQIKKLKRYVTNTSGHVFVLKNLPEVIKGALFSRYSRSSLGLRSLLLKEFLDNEEDAAFHAIVGEGPGEESADQQTEAIQKAQSFYDRILDGYGDDSIGELGGAHMAIENISMIAAKQIEDLRIGGSPLEKSTRYIYFDQKVQGDYLFYKEPVLMTSAYRNLYLDTCRMLFETYSRLIPTITQMVEEKFPKDPNISKTAYTAACRAKVLDMLRGLLPAGTLTNMGLYGNGRFFEHLLHRLQCHTLAEAQEIGRRGLDELSLVIPSFVRRARPEHKTHAAFSHFYEGMQEELARVAKKRSKALVSKTEESASVKLLSWDEKAVEKVAAALLYPHTQASLEELQEMVGKLSEEEICEILDTGCSLREGRRHRSPRALEHASFTFELLSDFGSYRDLHRHRMLTQERQLLTCSHGFFTPAELKGSAFETEYAHALKEAKKAYDQIAQELPEEAQYVVPMAFRIRWYFVVNLRALQWLTELRSSPAGHPSYRYTAQEMAKAVIARFPAFERFFKFVDYDGHELGRLGQEQKKIDKQQRPLSL